MVNWICVLELVTEIEMCWEVRVIGAEETAARQRLCKTLRGAKEGERGAARERQVRGHPRPSTSSFLVVIYLREVCGRAMGEAQEAQEASAL